MTYSNYYKDLDLARESSFPWGSHYANDFKKWLKLKLKKDQNNLCCYCSRDLQNESDRVIHIEHVLPKSKYKPYVFDIANLAISCVRCNSDLKRDKEDFMHPSLKQYKDVWSYKVYVPSMYRLVHPKLDNMCEHLESSPRIIDGRIYYIYRIVSEKGFYTYNFFDLKAFEIESINANQGIKEPSFHSDIKVKVEEIFRYNGL